MDILKAEIERKRKLLESRSLVGPEKKFFKREELIQKWDEEYHEKQCHKYGLKTKQFINNNNLVNAQNDTIRDNNTENGLSSSSMSSGSNVNSNDDRILPRKEVIKRLRERSEPILLFGETEIESFRRLRKLEILEPESSDRGFRNDFQVIHRFIHLFYIFFLILTLFLF
jgi:pre-mRNA-splicing factor 18